MSNPEHRLRFMFDPVCPWTWLTSLWVRAAARSRPIELHWGLLSLEFLNRNNPDNPFRESHIKSRHPLRLLFKARELGGEGAMDRLYLAIGRSRFDQDRELDDESMLAQALQEAELPARLLDETRIDPEIDRALRSEYEHAEVRGAFGVPIFFLDDDELPYFGPVIDTVPPDDQAGELFDLVAGFANHEYFYELKRPRI